MSPRSEAVDIANDHTSKDGDGRLRVWMYDAWCATPWYTAALTAALEARQLSVRLVCPHYHHEPEFFSSSGIDPRPGPFDFTTRRTIRPAFVRQALRFAEYAGNTWSLIGDMGRHTPHIIHLQLCPLLGFNIPCDLLFVRKAQERGIRCVHTVHNLLPHRHLQRAVHLHAKFYNACDRLICHSQQVAAELTRKFSVPAESIDVIPHGPLFASSHSAIDARRRLGLDPKVLIFLAQGVLSPYKGTDLLLDAWARMLKELPAHMPRPALVIAGRGQPSVVSDIMNRVAVNQLDSTVRLDLGYIPANRLPLYFEAADVLCFPYRDITTSGALCTGLSYNKPIIASDLATFRELLFHWKNALMVRPGDVPSLQDALLQLVTDPTLLLHLGIGSAGNRSLLPQWSDIADLTSQAYCRAIQEKAGPHTY